MQLLISLFLFGMVSAARQSIYYPLPSLFIPTGHPRITRSPADNVINIISETNEPNAGDGSYSYSYQTENGITAQEQGYLKEDVPEGPVAAAQGSYSYTLDDGQTITVTYTADENGFVVQGDHIPKPPPIPEAILRALELNAAEEANGDGSDFEPTNILKRHTENYSSQQRKR